MARVLVMGTGGVGGAFGAMLQDGGHDVVFCARGANLEALRATGLIVGGARGWIELPRVDAVVQPLDAGPVDLVLLSVKRYDLETAAAALARCGGLVVTLQNGVDAADVAAGVLGPRVLAGTTGIVADLAEPGRVEIVSSYARIRFGEPDGGGITPRVEEVARWLRAGGVEALPEADVRVALWEKMALICAMAGLTTARREPIGVVLATPDFEAIIREAEMVARAAGVGLPDDFTAERLAYARTVDPAATSSMLRDLQRGKRLEAEWLNGAIVRMGADLGVRVPHNERVMRAIA